MQKHAHALVVRKLLPCTFMAFQNHSTWLLIGQKHYHGLMNGTCGLICSAALPSYV